jgi:aminoglycoside phosphotransferase (APT) family kinase protein
VKMHADEVDVDVRLVRSLVAAQLPEWSRLPVEPVLPRGTDNALYRLGEELVVRLPRTPRTEVALRSEREWLPRLAPHLPLEAPAPLADGEPGEGYPFRWAVYTWLDGENATRDRIADDTRLAADLAELIAALQRIDPAGGPRPGPWNVFRGQPISLRDEPVRAAIAKLAESIDGDRVIAVWEQDSSAPEWDRAPVWIHGDLDSRNLLARDGRLSGVVDWGCVGVGDPACDVMVAWKMLSREAREPFRAALSVDEATWARANAWALSQALMALSYYTLETNGALVREAERWLLEVLAERGV